MKRMSIQGLVERTNKGVRGRMSRDEKCLGRNVLGDFTGDVLGQERNSGGATNNGRGASMGRTEQEERTISPTRH